MLVRPAHFDRWLDGRVLKIDLPWQITIIRQPLNCFSNRLVLIAVPDHLPTPGIVSDGGNRTVELFDQVEFVRFGNVY